MVSFACLMSLGSAFTRLMLPQPEPSTTTRGRSRATVPSSCLRTVSSKGLGEDARCSACFFVCVAGPRSATCCSKTAQTAAAAPVDAQAWRQAPLELSIAHARRESQILRKYHGIVGAAWMCVVFAVVSTCAAALSWLCSVICQAMHVCIRSS
jgi:hypothetical protein